MIFTSSSGNPREHLAARYRVLCVNLRMRYAMGGSSRSLTWRLPRNCRCHCCPRRQQEPAPLPRAFLALPHEHRKKVETTTRKWSASRRHAFLLPRGANRILRRRKMEVQTSKGGNDDCATWRAQPDPLTKCREHSRGQRYRLGQPPEDDALLPVQQERLHVVVETNRISDRSMSAVCDAATLKTCIRRSGE